MSVFIGRNGSKPVFSLNRGSGTGNTAASHANPDANTIFHSDMPHLMVKKRHIVNLGNAGGGYFTGTLPSDLVPILRNRANVVIPIVVCRNASGTEYFHQMMGIGKSQSYAWSTTYGGIGISSMFGGSVHWDLNLEWGYYTNTSGRSIDDMVGMNSNAGYYVHNVECGEDYDKEFAFVMAAGQNLAQIGWPTGQARDFRRNWLPRAASPIYSNVAAYEKMNLHNPDYMAPMGPSGGAFDCVFVRAGGARNMTGRGVFSAATTNTVSRDIDYYDGEPIPDSSTGANSFVKAGLARHVSNRLISGWTEATYASMTPVRFEFLELNVQFNNTGGYTAQNIFTGTEIKISKTDFTIKNVNLRNVAYEMLSAVSTGAPSISTNFFTSNTQTSAANALPDGGAFRFFGCTASGGNGSWASNNVDGSIGSATQWNIGTYKFPTNSTVEIDSRTPQVKLNGTPVWSPSARPLLLFANDKASNLILGDNEYLRPIANGGVLQLGSVNAGLTAAGASVILMSLEWMSNDLCGPAGDPSLQFLITGGTAGGGAVKYSPQGIGRRLTKLDYDRGDGVSHQIVVLNANQYVPIMVTNAFSYSGAADPSGGKPKSRFQYYIRKNGSSGVIEFWACSRAVTPTVNGKPASPEPPYVQFPKLRVNVQRLS